MGHSNTSDFSTARFTPALEREFQANYYASNRPVLRAVAVFMVAMLCLVLFLSHYVPTLFDLPFYLPQIGFWTLLFALTWARAFERVWQGVAAVVAGVIALAVLNSLAAALVIQLGQNMTAVEMTPSVIQQKFHFVMQVMVLMASFVTLRLQWRPASALYLAWRFGRRHRSFRAAFSDSAAGFGCAVFVFADACGHERAVIGFLSWRRFGAARVLGQSSTRS